MMAVSSGSTLKIGLAMVLCLLTADFAWSQTDERAKLVEAAKKEGKLVWYTSTNVTESKPLLDDFEKLYGIKGEIFRASGEKTLNRIVTEGRAGRWDYDVVTISEVDALMDAKLLDPIARRKRGAIFRNSKMPTATGRRSMSTMRRLAITPSWSARRKL